MIGDGGGSDGGAICHTIIDDRFESSAPCLPWGEAYGSAGVEILGGEMRISPGANTISDGGCRNGAQQSITAGGMLVEVSAVATGPGSYTVMRTAFGGVEMGVSNGKLRLFDNPNITEEITYVPSEMRWWRLRLDVGQESLVADYSADGESWIDLDRITRPITMTMPELVAGVSVDDNPAPGYGAFATFRVCGE